MNNSTNKILNSAQNPDNASAKEYSFGGIEEFSLEKIEESILEESVYLDVFAGSDIAFKENIKPIENVLSSIQGLSCITYDYKVDNYSHKNFPSTRQVGVIAQELQSVFPELVRNDPQGNLEVNYTQLGTIALQAIKELSLQLEDSKMRITSLENQIAKLIN